MILGIIQVRMGSTRLPGKTLKNIHGKEMLLRLIERCKKSIFVDKFVISTADNEENAKIREFAEKNNIEYYAGSENDLMDRLYQTGKKFGARAIVRITGDCPLIEPAEIDRIVKFYLDNNEVHDYVSNNLKPTLPNGLDVEIIKFSTMENVWNKIKDNFWRELAYAYIFENPDKFSTKNLEYHVDLSHLRWTVDYQEDFDFVEKVFKELGNDFEMQEVLSFLDNNPKLSNINRMHNSRDKAYHDMLKDMGMKSQRKVRFNFPKNILVIGAGFIGEKHIKNLKEIYNGEISILESNEEKRNTIVNKYAVKAALDIDSALKKSDVVLICTEPASHIDLAKKVLTSKCHLFIEKPISHTLEKISTLKVLQKKYRKVIRIGYNMRFEYGLNLLKKMIEKGDLGKILSIKSNFISNLPLKYAGLDYRKEYVCKKNGEVNILDVSHEIDYLYWLFGPIKKAHAYSKKPSSLEVEDNLDTIIEFKSGIIANLHLGFSDISFQRNCEITGENGIIYWDFTEKKVKISKIDGSFEEIKYEQDINETYIDELRIFLDEINTGNPNEAATLEESIEVLNILTDLEK